VHDPAPRSGALEMRYTASSGIEGSNPSRSVFLYKIRDIGAGCARPAPTALHAQQAGLVPALHGPREADPAADDSGRRAADRPGARSTDFYSHHRLVQESGLARTSKRINEELNVSVDPRPSRQHRGQRSVCRSGQCPQGDRQGLTDERERLADPRDALRLHIQWH
jgi:hypothetical protein